MPSKHSDLVSTTPGLTVSGLRTPVNNKRKSVDLETRKSIASFKRVRLLHPRDSPSKQTHQLPRKGRRVLEWIDGYRSWEDSKDKRRRDAWETELVQSDGHLQVAALKGGLELVKNLLFDGKDTNGHGSDYVGSGTPETARCTGKQFLILNTSGYGCFTIDGLLADSYIYTALHAAVEGCHSDMVNFLLAHESDPDVNLPRLGTPLVMAARKRRTDIAEIILAYGADVNQRSAYAYSTETQITVLQRAAYEGDIAIVDLFLRYAADVNAEPGQYGPVLVAATVNDNLGLAERLLDAGVAIDATHRFGPDLDPEKRRQNALARAIYHDHLPLVNLLLSRGADLNLECECRNAIQNATFFGRDEIFHTLISQGADIYRPTKSYANVLEAAVAGGQGRMFRKLLSYGMHIHIKCPDKGNLQVAACSGDNSIVRYLIEQGMDINQQDGFYTTALTAAARHGHHSTCEILINSGSDLVLQNHRMGSALHAAVEYSHLETVRLLLDSGASINATGGKCGSLLQLAALNTSKEVVQLLFD
jgi:ankyrin repeat protein